MPDKLTVTQCLPFLRQEMILLAEAAWLMLDMNPPEFPNALTPLVARALKDLIEAQKRGELATTAHPKATTMHSLLDWLQTQPRPRAYGAVLLKAAAADGMIAGDKDKLRGKLWGTSEAKEPELTQEQRFDKLKGKHPGAFDLTFESFKSHSLPAIRKFLSEQ